MHTDLTFPMNSDYCADLSMYWDKFSMPEEDLLLSYSQNTVDIVPETWDSAKIIEDCKLSLELEDDLTDLSVEKEKRTRRITPPSEVLDSSAYTVEALIEANELRTPNMLQPQFGGIDVKEGSKFASMFVGMAQKTSVPSSHRSVSICDSGDEGSRAPPVKGESSAPERKKQKKNGKSNPKYPRGHDHAHRSTSPKKEGKRAPIIDRALEGLVPPHRLFRTIFDCARAEVQIDENTDVVKCLILDHTSQRDSKALCRKLKKAKESNLQRFLKTEYGSVEFKVTCLYDLPETLADWRYGFDYDSVIITSYLLDASIERGKGENHLGTTEMFKKFFERVSGGKSCSGTTDTILTSSSVSSPANLEMHLFR